MKRIWNLGIKLKIGIGFFFILAVLVAVQYGLNKSISKVIASQEEIISSTRLSTEIESIKSSVCFFESKVKGYVLTGNDTLLENNEKYLSDIVLKFKKLKTLSPNKEQTAGIDTLVSLLNQEIQFCDEVTYQYLVSPDSALSLIKSGKGEVLIILIIREFDKIQELEKGKFSEIILRNRRDSERVKLMDTSAYIFAFLLITACIFFLYRDINRRVRLEKELIIAQKKAENAAIIKEQFMANMSHEIRTPMNAIIGFNQRLSNTDLNVEQKEYVSAVQSSGENLLNIVNDILDFSKIEAGMVRIEKIHFNLHGLLDSVNEMFLVQAKEKGVIMKFHISKAVPDLVVGDPTRLTQILINLLSNALKFTREGRVDIVLDVLKDDREFIHIQFKVKDTGIGILEEKISEIFDRFTQEKSDTSRIYGGTGLGLSIVKKLVELQYGNITVKSEKDNGSEFTFSIPYKKATTFDENIEPNKQNDPILVLDNNIKVLVVEDNLLNQKLAGFMLKDWGFDYTICSNGREAVEKLKADEMYDIILMDIQMPEMNGYQTTEFIRNKLKLKMPIIAMTAHALPGERDKCVSYGMNDYISKPIKEHDLRELITKYINYLTTQNN